MGSTGSSDGAVGWVWCGYGTQHRQHFRGVDDVGAGGEGQSLFILCSMLAVQLGLNAVRQLTWALDCITVTIREQASISQQLRHLGTTHHIIPVLTPILCIM